MTHKYNIYNINNQIKFKITMLKSSLYDYSDAYILVSVTITVPNTEPVAVVGSNVPHKLLLNNTHKL